MAKRASIFLMMVFLLLSTAGVGISRHYCGGELRGVSFYSSVKSCCGKSEMPKGCCGEETEFNKLDSDFSPSSNVSLESPEMLALGWILAAWHFNSEVEAETEFPLDYGPPLVANSPSLSQLQRYLI